jgi:antitoxin PrlF
MSLQERGPVTSYRGTITTTGKAEAIRLEKALFRSHPEFRQKARVRADVVGTGHVLISVVVDDSSIEQEDPVVGAFLSFLERDMTERPDRIEPVSSSRIGRAMDLVADVEVSDEDPLPDDAGL